MTIDLAIHQLLSLTQLKMLSEIKSLKRQVDNLESDLTISNEAKDEMMLEVKKHKSGIA